MLNTNFTLELTDEIRDVPSTYHSEDVSKLKTVQQNKEKVKIWLHNRMCSALLTGYKHQIFTRSTQSFQENEKPTQTILLISLNRNVFFTQKNNKLKKTPLMQADWIDFITACVCNHSIEQWNMQVTTAKGVQFSQTKKNEIV